MKHRLVAALRRTFARPTVIEISDGAELMHAAHWIERSPLRMMVPVHLLRMQGAFPYDQDHPFLQALDHGRGALEDFYASFTPANLGEFYRLPGPGRPGFDLPTWEIPWYKRAKRAPPPGELGLGADHGVSF